MKSLKCRHCQNELVNVFIDLDEAPPSNSYLESDDEFETEKKYPLKVFVCNQCWLVQTADFAAREEFFSATYAYFSSTSTTWLEHARNYFKEISTKLRLDTDSFVVEIASNDGYLLNNFVRAGIPCLGIEPTASTAEVAIQEGVNVVQEFFGNGLAGDIVRAKGKADLVIGNNVYAHVPDINDFTRGLASLLADQGTITLEFPHLLNLIKFNQFDTIYHEHYSYLSLTSVKNIVESEGLRIYDVETLDTHGGSLRVYLCHTKAAIKENPRVSNMLRMEKEFGLGDLETYALFQNQIAHIAQEFRTFLMKANQDGSKVAAYGAAAKGNTLLNFMGIKSDLIIEVYDAATAKQGKYLPGSHIKIESPDQMEITRPDFVVIFPWNISNEIQGKYGNTLANWGGKFVLAIPELRVLN